MDQLMFKVKNYIIRHQLIEKGDCVLVGLSGGPDSVFLLHALDMFRKSMGYSLFAIHVHHGIRGEEADRDMEFSHELCDRWDIPFKVAYVDAPGYAREKGLSLEEAARILRYEAFENERQAISMEHSGERDVTCRIAVAHHLDDQAETVLHNMVRGSGIRGLSGMEPRRGFIIRPLLSTKREYILSKLKDDGISYVIDSTNLDIQYTRNHIRSEILPELREINPEAAAHIAQTAELLREADDYFVRLAAEYVDRCSVIRDVTGTARDPKDRDDSDITDSTRLCMTGRTVSADGCSLVHADRAGSEADLLSDSSAKEISIPVTELKTYPELVRQYVMMELVRRIGTPLKDWGSVHFRDLDKLIYGPGNAHLDLPYKMSADYRKKHLILRINQDIISVKRRKNNGRACKSSDSGRTD